MVGKKLIKDELAYQNIKNLIKFMKEKGNQRVDVIDIMSHFSYSPIQIQKIMKVLENEGLVKEE